MCKGPGAGVGATGVLRPAAWPGATCRPCGSRWAMGSLERCVVVGGLGLGNAQPHPGYVCGGWSGGRIGAEQCRKWNPGFSEGWLSGFRARTSFGLRSGLSARRGCEFALLKTALSSLGDLETTQNQAKLVLFPGNLEP